MSIEQAATGSVAARLRRLSSTPVFAVLAAVDLVFIALSVAHQFEFGIDLADQSPWLLETDRGWSEWFGYAQEATIAVLLLVLAVRTRRWAWVPFAVLFGAALADDSLRLHENYGAWLADRAEYHFSFPTEIAGLRASDLGEMTVWGVLAVLPLAAAVLLYRRTDRGTRRLVMGMAALVAAYVFFGGVLDQAHVLVLDTPFDGPAGTLEDGGELVVLSATVAYALGLVLATRRQARTAPGEPAIEAAQSRETALASSSPA